MTKQRKHYEAAFKLEVARMVVDQGMSVAQVVKDMNIGRTAVNRWIEHSALNNKASPASASRSLSNYNASAHFRPRTANCAQTMIY